MVVPRQVPQIDAAVNCLPTIVVCSVTVSLAWIAISLRLWTKLRIVKMVGWDDWIMLIATVFFTVYCASVINISTRVTSTHQIVSFPDLLISVNLLNVAEVFYILSIMTLKIALAVFFLRLTVQLWQRRVVLVALVISSSFSVLMFLFVVFQCGVYDNATVFLLRRLANQCASNNFTLGMTYSHAIITTLTDWAFLVLPFFVLKESLMNKNEKRTVVVILMFASIGAIASIIRFRFIDGLAIPRNEFFANARDIGIWSCLEPGIGIIAGSIVTLRPLIRRLVVLFKNSSYANSKFPRWRSPPNLHRTPSNAYLQQPAQRNPGPVCLQQKVLLQEMDIVEKKGVVKREVWIRQPTAKRRSMSGLPLHLFGSMRSISSSERTKSTKLSTSQVSHSSIGPTLPGTASFIRREATDDSDERSTKASERDDYKHSERGDSRMGRSSTWLAQDSEWGDPGVRPSPTFEEEEDWSEAQLSPAQLSPTYVEHERRFSQRAVLYSSTSNISSPRFAPRVAQPQSLRWHQHDEPASSEFIGVPEIFAAPLSPLFPEGHEWYQILNLGGSRPNSYIPGPEVARIPIGLQTPPALPPSATPHMTPRGTPRQSQSYVWHERQGSENSIIRARIESVPSEPASPYQGRTSEDSARWPSTAESVLQEETLRINREQFPPRTSSRTFPPRDSSRAPFPQDNGVRFLPYSAAPELPPSISPRRFWQQKPLPRLPPVERNLSHKGILKTQAPAPVILLPPMPSMPVELYRVWDEEQGKEKRTRTSGLPLDSFFGSALHASPSSDSSL